MKHAISLIALGTVVFLSAGCASRPGGLLQGLEAASATVFNEGLLVRLAPRYALGKPEYGLPELFVANGMKITRHLADVNGSVTYVRAEKSSGFCGSRIVVTWRVSAEGRITELGG